MYRRVERFTRALDTPQLDLIGPVEIGKVYVSAELKGHEHDQKSCSRGLSTRGRGLYRGDKPPAFTIVDRGTGQRYVVPAKSTDESTAQLLFADHEKESLTVYTSGLRACDPLEDDDESHREYVVYGDSEYADGDVHANTYESHASLARQWFSSHWGVSKDRLTQYLRAFQLRSELFRKPDQEALKHAVKAAL